MRFGEIIVESSLFSFRFNFFEIFSSSLSFRFDDLPLLGFELVTFAGSFVDLTSLITRPELELEPITSVADDSAI